MSEGEILLRTSERSCFMRCPQKWEWSYNQKLKPNYTSPPLRFGSLIHDALATYYKPGKVMSRRHIKRGPHPAQTFLKLYDAQIDQLEQGMRVRVDEEWMDARPLGEEMMVNYIDLYGRDDKYRIVAPEMPFQIDMNDPDTGEYLCTYVGTFDAVIQNLETMQIGLFEHKTAASISTDHLSMDEQASSYWAFAPDWMWARGILKPGQDLDFILYNFLRKGTKDTRPVNGLGQALNGPKKEALVARCEELGLVTNRGAKVEDLTELLRSQGEKPELLGEVSKVQPAPLFERFPVYRGNYERAALMWRVILQAREMKMYRDGRLHLYKRPMNGCRGMFGCEFRDMCEIHEVGSDWEAIRDQMFHEWEPYEIHERKGAED